MIFGEHIYYIPLHISPRTWFFISINRFIWTVRHFDGQLFPRASQLRQLKLLASCLLRQFKLLAGASKLRQLQGGGLKQYSHYGAPRWTKKVEKMRPIDLVSGFQKSKQVLFLGWDNNYCLKIVSVFFRRI